ncbi:leucyl aminopeptidase [Verticillium dahliae VdLs.17]|uniref:Peptide hydrolase n=1 Tax=Verticillium dahliae (strain VdLs.17 / ATCC MYA-4575 / FGSC 10137) TaxID=498257 RepID=G2XFE5_VERDV|nr:leucyl aminopeptidase [Verticillium dahliae VdLs.17]EGY18543.1 leucyl aminopeptidase [Verticillium dahliae VdLs.17]KAH6692049.1 leucyl aminopeptidase [Verticillium dahliae]
MRVAVVIAFLAPITEGLLLMPSEPIFTLELGPGCIRTVMEAGKKRLEADGYDYTDLTHSSIRAARADGASTDDGAKSMPPQNNALDQFVTLNATALAENLLGLTGFHTRYYKSQTGIQSSKWLLGRIQAYISGATSRGVKRASFRVVDHNWKGQKSIIVSLKGNGNGVVVLGAHQDSINGLDPIKGHAPGADDNGTGSITILEALRAILDSDLALKDSEHTLEFHWYAGEEAGLLGSNAIFNEYARDDVNVVAMLNFDMTGYVKPNTKPTMGVITDNVDPKLTQRLREIIEKCSDHASATLVGFPSAFIFESTFENSNEYIHTPEDTIEKVDFGHVYEFAKLAVAAAYELAW